MSRAGKAKSKRVKWLPADREDGADTGQKTGHGKSPEASAVSRGGGDGPIMDPKKIKRYVRFGGKSPNNPSSLQSTASSLAAVGDASSQGEAIEGQVGVVSKIKISDPIATRPFPIPRKPGRPMASEVTHNAIQLSWSGPESGGRDIIFYSVLYRRIGDPSSQWLTQNVQGAQEVTTVNGLASKALYCFRVRAHGENGVYSDSETSEQIATSPQPILGKPGRPIATNVAHDSVQIKWSDPEPGGQDIKFYSVLFRRMDDRSSHWLAQIVQGFQEVATVSGLASKALYCFRVRAHGENDVCSESETSEQIATSPQPILGKPGRPIATNVAHDSVQIKWSGPEPGGQDIKYYSVLYRQVGDPSSQWLAQNVQGGQEVATVCGLASKALYCFKVRAHGENGVYSDSETDELIATSPQPVLGKPSRPKATNRMDDPSSQWLKRSKQDAQAVATVSRLAANAVYLFKVRAEGEDGVFSESEMSDLITTNPILIAMPGKPMASKVTHNSIQLRWSGPESGNHNIKYYSVLYRQLDDPSSQWLTRSTQDTQEVATVSGLAAKVVYCFKVRAVCEGGVSPVSELSDPIATSSPPIPGRPGKPTVSKVMHNSIHLSWPCPVSGSEGIKFYSVLYLRMDDPSGEWLTTKTLGSQEEATVTKLTAKAVYCFKVRAVCESGASLDSELSDPIATSPSPVPGRPGKPTASKVTHNSIHLNWPGPESGIEGVMFYSVLYRRMDDMFGEWKTTKTDSSQEEATVTKLAAKAVYCFKVRAECNAGVSPDSELSDPIATSPSPVPGRPGKPTASKVTHNSIHLNWPGPESGIEGVMFYSVLYRRMDDMFGEWKTTKTDSSQEEATVTKLAAKAVYCFKVRAECNAGVSPDSELSDPIATSPSPVPGRPGKPTVSKVMHNSIHLSWPCPVSGSEGIKFYSVLYLRMDDPSGEWLTTKTLGSQEEATMTKLTAKAVYCFKVRAVCESGASLDSELSDPIATSPSPVPGRPGKPTASKVTHNSIHLNWPGPESGIEGVMFYSVLYRRMDDMFGEWKTTKTDSSQEEATVTKLAAKAVYCFKVRAECNAGVSPDSEMSDPIATSPSPVPGRPGKPTASKVTHNSIHLNWPGPESGIEGVMFYSVLYRRMDDMFGEWKTTKTDSSQEEATVTKLAAKAVYCFKVRAECNAGVSPDSELSDPIATSPSPVPGRPGKPTASKVTHNSIHLNWPGPESGIEGVMFYSVLYRRMDDMFGEWKTTKTDSSQEEATVTKLAAKAVYCFKVRAECNAGVSPDSELSDPIATSPSPVPGRPGKPTVSKVMHNSIHLSWPCPVSGSEGIKFYSVLYLRMDDPSGEWLTTKTLGSQEEATMTKLTAKAVYCFKVRAVCESGASLDSELSDPIATSPSPVPGRPGKPTASKVTHNSIHLNWPGPESGIEGVMFYSVLYRRMDDMFGEWKTTKTDSSQEEATVTKLAAKAVYCFKVRAECNAGVSPDSEMSDPIATSPSPVPGRPGKPTASKVTHNSIHLNWPGPESGIEGVMFYSVLYRRMDDMFGEWKTTKTDSSQEEATVTKLAAKAVYCFKVRAECNAGVSPDSELSDPIATSPSPVPGRPGKPTASKVTHNSIHLNWPGPESGIEGVMFYSVLYRRMDDMFGEWKTTKTDSSQEEATVTKLAAKAVYCFKVRAECNAGVSPDSELSDPIATSPSPVPGRPGKPTVSKVMHNSIHLSWPCPVSGSEGIKFYSVLYLRMDDPSGEWLTTKTLGSQEEATMTKLTAKAVYCFKVRAVCESGASLDSELSDPIATSPSPVPGRPGKPTASKVTHNSIHLNWPGPESGIEGVMFYSVLYRRMDDMFGEWKTTKTDSSQEEATVTKLAAKAVYCFKVRAECNAGVSPDSELSDPIATSPSPVPGRPGKPTASKVTHNSIHLNWPGPESGIEGVMFYSVLYRRMDDLCGEWKTTKTDSSQEEATVTKLAAKAVYCFKVRAECNAGVSPDSEMSDPIATSPPPVQRRPGKPMASKVSHNSIQLRWSGPESGKHNIKFYSVLYRRAEDPSSQWLTRSTQDTQEVATVSGLAAKAVYLFKVRAEGKDGFCSESKMSDPIATNSHPIPWKPGRPMASEVTCKTEVGQLRGDLEVIHNETPKAEKRREPKGEAVRLRLQSTAQKFKQDQLHCQLHQTETDLNLSKARVAELERGITVMKTALSEAKHDRQAIYQEVGVLRKENDELKEEIAAQKAEAVLWKEDFRKERRDREQAAGRIDGEQAQLRVQHQYLHDKLQKCHTTIHNFESENEKLRGEIRVHRDEMKNYQQVMTDYDNMQLQLVQHKDQVASMEQLFQAQQQEHKAQLEQANRLQQTQLEDVHRQLKQANQQLDQAVTDNEKLNDDVLARTQQVKQYKKQVDGLKAEVENYKSQVTSNQEVDAEKTQQINNLRRQLQESMARQHHQEVASARANQQLRGAIQRLNNQLQLSQHITEKETLLQAAQAEQLRLRQLMQEKDRVLQGVLSEKDQLRQQLSTLSGQIQRQSQRPHESNFWEVPRNEITLNMHKFLGTGAWGFVVEGKFRGQQVAVKCLHDLIRQPAVIEVIRKEICIMAQIRHPNIVLLIAAVIDAKNDPLIVTELLDISLRKAYENHRLQGSKLNIFRDVASALNYLHLHQRGEIIHRDVSSANVLLEAKPNNQWKAKLSDFGSAKLAMEAKTTGPGAPAYTAPEVRKDIGIRQTGKLDVYSYGVLLCEVTVEQFPMDDSLPGMMQTVQSRWPFMHGLVSHCIQDHPDNRPAMSHVLGEFDKLLPNE